MDDDRVRGWAGGGSWQNDDDPAPPPPPPPPPRRAPPRPPKKLPQPLTPYRPTSARGLVAGRFDPLHRGHEHLLDTASRSSRELDVVVFHSPSDLVPVATRLRWVAETCPTATVVAAPASADFASAVRDATGRPLAYDAYYGGELGSGATAAAAVGAAFVPVDPNRDTFPAASTRLRADLGAHFDDLALAARPFFVRRVAVIGPESTGKTDLCRRLAQHYGTRWVPEPARALASARGGDLDWSAIELWARTQMATEDAAAPYAARVLFSDTDLDTVRRWSTRLFGTSPPELDEYVEQREYDLHLICLDDVPFVGAPERDQPEERRAMMERCLAYRERGGVVVRGSFEERLHAARAAVDAMLGDQRWWSKRGERMLSARPGDGSPTAAG
jgi:HTH-type transcriptional repressor of NAD biosynthesis genes